jgi:hypothetical protein
MAKRREKSLGQIAYEASKEGGQQNFGPWAKAPQIVRDVHEQMAEAVAKVVRRKARRKPRPSLSKCSTGNITGSNNSVYKKFFGVMEDLNPDALKADGFDEAVVGIGERCGQPALFVYDRNKCLKILVRDGMTEEEAVEYFDFNVSGAWVGEHTPIWMDTLDGM